MGAASEADLFRQSLWDEKGHNARIRVAFLHPIDPEKVPVRLRAWHQFRPFDQPQELKQLIRWLATALQMEELQTPAILWPEPTKFEPDIVDRNKREWPTIVAMLAGRLRERILLLEGSSGVGKSELLRQARTYAKKLAVPVAYIDFRGGMQNLHDVLGHISLEIGNLVPNFTNDGATKTHLLRRDLRNLKQPILLIFDGYEGAAENKAITDWVNQQLLPEVETSLSVAVIIAGQASPRVANATWRELAQYLVLEPITDFEAWREWTSRKFPRVGDLQLQVLVTATKGSPGLMLPLCANLAGTQL